MKMNKSEIDAIARKVNETKHRLDIQYWEMAMEGILSVKKLLIKDLPKYTKRVIALAKEYPGDNPPEVSKQIMDQVILTNMDQSTGSTRIGRIVQHAVKEIYQPKTFE